MLNLAAPTRPGWLEEALSDLDAVLLDHAHCEKKAASVALSFIFRYPQHTDILAPLSALAREELAHFELLLDLLHRRQIPYARQVPSAYGGRLLAPARHNEPARMLDLMLCAALIEARSCERMKILHEAFSLGGPRPDPDLAQLYGGLLASEARHHHLYLDICLRCHGREDTLDRLRSLASHEADILSLPGAPARMHS